MQQIYIDFNELTDVQPVAEGGFGVIHRAKHHRWGTVVYKQLKTSNIPEASRFVFHVVLRCIHTCCDTEPMTFDACLPARRSIA